MNFKKNRYVIIKKLVSQELCNFLTNYLIIKRQCAKTLFETKQISPYSVDYGRWTDPQVPNTYTCYGDIAIETLLLKIKPEVEKITKLKLIESYSFCRIYKKGDELKRHKDRDACEISATLNLGGDDWPIYVSPYENLGYVDNKNFFNSSNAKGIKIKLEPGDMMLYAGCEIEHWRNKFKGQECFQAFFHYNTEGRRVAFDGRPHVGLPEYTAKDYGN
tara:strand:- start:476 stop:1129 length:654 start_codon:yes stop_codon:yes gene_type:complete